MQNEQVAVIGFFEESGYTLSTQVATAPQLLLFEATFAGLGVYLAPTAEDALNKWADLQTAIGDARAQRPRGRLKDWYLVFIVPEIHAEDGPGIQDLINDTHVCRKIVLEQKERPLAEVLSEMPFFRGAREPVSATSELLDGIVELSRPGLPVNLLTDLAKRSPQEIIKRTLKGKYKSSGGQDEAESH